MFIKCLGCGRDIGELQGGIFCYTCPCGATVFEGEHDTIIPPASFMLLKVNYLGEEPPHIDYYLGKSNHWSDNKQKIYDFLIKKGAIWSWECEECKDHVIERTKRDIEWGLLPSTLHPNLSKLCRGIEVT